MTNKTIEQQIKELQEWSKIEIKEAREYEYQGQFDYDCAAQDISSKALLIIKQLQEENKELKKQQDWQLAMFSQ